jgi:hydroxymethylbilane synthase
LQFVPVRGNIQTRLTRLAEGRGDALVVAKAALDRLLGFGGEFQEAANTLRNVLERCQWMVLPVREVPGAPAQGALAVEVARDSIWADRLRAISHEPTFRAVLEEREVLASYGGGCHQALGATVLPRGFGRIVSVRGKSDAGRMDQRWSLEGSRTTTPQADASRIWPRPDERYQAVRRALTPAQPATDAGYWVARAEALPESWPVGPERFVWTAGSTTWRRLAARGIWVHGCADGLGDDEPPPIDDLAGRRVTWHRLTHQEAAVDDSTAIATYVVDDSFPDDLPARTHCFWMSGTRFDEALARWPGLRDAWHGSGPGRTRRAIQAVLGSSDRASVWLDYDDWLKDVLNK